VLGGDDLRAGREVKLGPAGTGEPYAVAGADLLVSRLVHRDRLADAAGGGAAPGGIPAADALASATSVAARACGLGDRKGRLRAGYDADLVVVDGDPHADIRALSAVQAVYLNGQAVTQLAA
jgi:imidazolonepropionase-like amidohydrolase